MVMRAVLCRAFGPPESLVVAEQPAPALGAGQVRIKVAAAGLNFADTLIVQGRYQVKPPLPFTPGFEAAGTILEAAPDVSGLARGERVIAVPDQGCFAEEVVCPAAVVVKLPDAMDFATGAAFPVAYGTAHAALDFRARLQPGETLLVLGAAGGVGLAAVEIGKAMGATVIAAARGKAKLELARAHGADHVVDYEEENLRVAVRNRIGRGVDVVFDPVGGELFDVALRLLEWEGRLVVIGFAAGAIPQAPANILLIKNVAVLGLYWGQYWKKQPARVRASFAQLFAWWRDGRLKPEVSGRYKLKEVAAALAELIHRRATGKLVLEMAREGAAR
jgi:NADPH2:quinone reductase